MNSSCPDTFYILKEGYVIFLSSTPLESYKVMSKVTVITLI